MPVSFDYDSRWKIHKQGESEFDADIEWLDSLWAESPWSDLLPGHQLSIISGNDSGYIWITIGTSSLSDEEIFAKLADVNYFKDGVKKFD